LCDQFGNKFNLSRDPVGVLIVKFPVMFRGNTPDEKVIAFELTKIVPPFRLADQPG
jgi:hypothetical protein